MIVTVMCRPRCVVLLCVTESCVLPWRVCFWFNIGIVLEFQVILQCNLYRAIIVILFIVINTLLFVSLILQQPHVL